MDFLLRLLVLVAAALTAWPASAVHITRRLTPEYLNQKAAGQAAVQPATDGEVADDAKAPASDDAEDASEDEDPALEAAIKAEEDAVLAEVEAEAEVAAPSGVEEVPSLDEGESAAAKEGGAAVEAKPSLVEVGEAVLREQEEQSLEKELEEEAEDEDSDLQAIGSHFSGKPEVAALAQAAVQVSAETAEAQEDELAASASSMLLQTGTTIHRVSRTPIHRTPVSSGLWGHGEL